MDDVPDISHLCVCVEVKVIPKQRLVFEAIRFMTQGGDECDPGKL